MMKDRINQTTLSVVMEHRCGHPPLTLIEAPFYLKGDHGFQINKIVGSLPKRPDGLISCVCQTCGRGAGWIVTKLGDKVIGRDEVNDLVERGWLDKSDLSREPSVDSN